MAEKNWFWRTIGFWFVPAKRGTLGREEWGKIQRVSRSGKSRTARRTMVILWLCLVVFDAAIAVFAGRHWMFAGLAMTVGLVCSVLWAVGRMPAQMALPTLEDRAEMEFGVEFEALQEIQRGEIAQKLMRESVRGLAHIDEREAELRLQSEGAAYRLLRPGMLGAAAVYWAVCLLGPFAAERWTLAVTAVGFSWLAVVVIVLPTMVRMWTQPDEVGEAKIVAMEREA